MKKKKQNKRWYMNFWILLIITLIDYFLLDPIPLIDEFILTLWTTKLGINKFLK